MEINKIVLEIIKYYNEFAHNKLIVDYVFTFEGSYNFIVNYEDNGVLKESELVNRPIRSTIRIMSEYFVEKRNSLEKFNRVHIEILTDGTFTEKYFWDSGKEKQDLLSYSEIFFQWANDRMMSMIYEYEQSNNLLPTRLDDDGDLEYLSSWDRGVFSFHVKGEKLEYKIILTKNNKDRILEMPLKDYFIESLLEHHRITHTELKVEWKSWNTIVIKSPHTGIPYDKVDQYVNYSFEL